MSEKHNISALFDRHGNLTLPAIERYLRHTLDEEDRAMVERHLEVSPFDREAVEGFRMGLAESHPDLLENLNEAIADRARHRQKDQERGFFRRFRWPVAASLAVIMSLASVMYMMGRNQGFNFQFAFMSRENRNWEPVTVSGPDPSGMEEPKGLAGMTAPKPPSVVNRAKFMAEERAETEPEIVMEDPDIPDETMNAEEAVANLIMEEEAPDEDQYVFIVVEEMPGFPGGEEALMKFLAKNMRYPVLAKENGIQGRVYVNFIVNTDGSVSDVRVLKGIGGGCDEEAVRVVSMMPKWEPGRQRGIPTRVQYNLPVRFKLE